MQSSTLKSFSPARTSVFKYSASAFLHRLPMMLRVGHFHTNGLVFVSVGNLREIWCQQGWLYRIGFEVENCGFILVHPEVNISSFSEKRLILQCKAVEI